METILWTKWTEATTNTFHVACKQSGSGAFRHFESWILVKNRSFIFGLSYFLSNKYKNFYIFIFCVCISRKCDGPISECQSLHPVHLELEVISTAPRAFIIKNFLNEFEVNAIISAANSRLHHSSVGDTETGAFESDVRTSSNAWLPRDLNEITDTLFRRAADLIQIDERHLHRSDAAEDMQVVHYQAGQRYDAHHDWGVSGYPESRYLTLLLYLTDMASPNAGGETSFPKADEGRGIKVHPGKGNAVLFYNLLPDGNGDDLALHAALPVWMGEKWLANFWVWDPKMK